MYGLAGKQLAVRRNDQHGGLFKRGAQRRIQVCKRVRRGVAGLESRACGGRVERRCVRRRVGAGDDCDARVIGERKADEGDLPCGGLVEQQRAPGGATGRVLECLEGTAGQEDVERGYGGLRRGGRACRTAADGDDQRGGGQPPCLGFGHVNPQDALGRKRRGEAVDRFGMGGARGVGDHHDLADRHAGREQRMAAQQGAEQAPEPGRPPDHRPRPDSARSGTTGVTGARAGCVEGMGRMAGGRAWGRPRQHDRVGCGIFASLRAGA